MCHPAAIPLITAGLGATQAGVQYAGARQQAKQQARYQAQASAAERQRFMQEQTSIRMRQAQEQEAVGRELEQVSRKSQAALARARVAAGEAGVAGASVQALMDDYMRQEAGYRSALVRQQELGAVATGLGLEQAGFATQQRQIGINQPINRPSAFGGFLNVLSGGLGGFRTGLGISRLMFNPSAVPSEVPEVQRFDGTVSAQTATTMPTFLRPSTISLGGGKTSTYMPDTDQYSI
jgi:hypothetical protein